MSGSRVIYIGSQNLGGLLDDGETMKNHYLSAAIERYVDKVYRIDVRHRPMIVWYLSKLLFYLLFLRNSKVVISCSSKSAYGIVRVMKLLRWKGSNIYYWVIGGKFGTLIQQGKLQKKHYLDLHTIIVEGESMKRQLTEEGFTNVKVLPNVKIIDYIPQLRLKTVQPAKFVFLSRVMPEKGVDYIIEATRQLVNSGVTDFTVDIYGKVNPDYEAVVRTKTEDLCNVSYKGFLMLNTANGYDILSSYDAMLFPTYWHGEGFPGILIDAFVAGLPVIASDWNLNASLIKDKYNGLIIPVHNVDALATAMQQVISKDVDINQMSANAQNDVKKFDVRNVISKQLLVELGLI